MFATTELFLLFLLALIGAAAAGFGIAREPSTGKAALPSRTGGDAPDTATSLEREVVSPSTGSWNPALLIIAGMAVTFINSFTFFVKANDRTDAFRGAPRIATMSPGRYRVMYRLPDNSGALVRSIDTGVTRFYVYPDAPAVLDPDKQYCFMVYRAGCKSHTHTITCPAPN